MRLLGSNIFVAFILAGGALTAARRQPQAPLPEMIDKVRGSVVEVTISFSDLHMIGAPPGVGPVVPQSLGQNVVSCFDNFMRICIVGTGFFVADGEVVTADHVFEDTEVLVQKLSEAGLKPQATVIIPLPNYEKADGGRHAYNYVGEGFRLRARPHTM
jgi:hypothetical protein